MGVKFKDYYEILGVPRDATEEQIKAAFRRLARKYHPDINKGDKDAESKFKDINEAYEVLRDKEKRRLYDQLGPNWQNGQDFRPPPGWENIKFHFTRRGPGGFRFSSSPGGFSDFFETLFGGFDLFSDSNDLFSERDIFGGQDGWNNGRPQRGEDLEVDVSVSVEDVYKGATKRMSFRFLETCPSCGGTGSGPTGICRECRGQGKVERTRSFSVKIPPGVLDGDRIRLANQGTQARDGGEPGDLYLRIHLAPHPLYKVEGRDLVMDLKLAPWEAALGTRVKIPTLDGRVNLKVPAGTSSGTRLRLRGKGLLKRGSGRGDLYAVVRIVVPEKLSERERELFESLARESGFNPRN